MMEWPDGPWLREDAVLALIPEGAVLVTEESLAALVEWVGQLNGDVVVTIDGPVAAAAVLAEIGRAAWQRTGDAEYDALRLTSPRTVEEVAAAMHRGRLTGCAFTGERQACSPSDHVPDARSYLSERRAALRDPGR